MKHIILLFACIYLTFSVNLSAQNVAGSVEVGVYSAYQFTQFSGGYIELPSGKYDNDPYTAYGFTVGGLAEVHFTPTFAVLALLRYEELHGNKIRIGDKYPSKLADGTEIMSDINHVFEVKAPQFASTFLGKYTLSDSKFSVLAGVSIGILINDKEEQLHQLVLDPTRPVRFPIQVDSFRNPTDTIQTSVVIKGQKPRYTDETRTSITLYSGPIYQRTALQLGLTAGLQYDLPIYTLDEATQKFVTLTPSVLFNYNLTTYSDYEKLRAWNVSAGFVLKVGL
ncbi:MAG: outer membrane beta-barrel protein [Candidatus Kapaibacterium sp.]